MLPGRDGCCSYRSLTILLPPEIQRAGGQHPNQANVLTLIISPSSYRMASHECIIGAFHVLPFGRRGLAWHVRSDILEPQQGHGEHYLSCIEDPASGCHGWVNIRHGFGVMITAAA